MTVPVPLPDTPAGTACPVCGAGCTAAFMVLGGRDYRRCADCAARYLVASQHPTREAEYAQYRLHENDPDDPRYRRFLSKLADPLLERLAPRSRGLD